MKAIVPDEYDPRVKKYHRVVVTRHGGPDVLQAVEEDLPEPQAGEVRVKILAAGVSTYDLMQRRSGSLPGTPRVPYTPGEDIVGVVDKLGEGVSAVERGQTVAGYPRGGGYAEFICLPANELVPVPAGVDPAEAVCLVTNYLTAHMLLHPTVNMRSCERVLVHGAAGGVGSALLGPHWEPRRSTTAPRISSSASAASPVTVWMPRSTPSAAPGTSGVHTAPCAKTGGCCGLAWLRRRRKGCGSFPSL